MSQKVIEAIRNINHIFMEEMGIENAVSEISFSCKAYNEFFHKFVNENKYMNFTMADMNSPKIEGIKYIAKDREVSQ